MRWCIIAVLFFVSATYNHALTLPNAIEQAIGNNTAIKLAQMQAELEYVAQWESRTAFLPSLTASYIDGERRTEISRLSDNLDENTKSLTLTQSLFNGFSSVSDIRAAKYSKKAALERLKQAKHDLALQVSEHYVNSLYLRRILALEEQKSGLMNEAFKLAGQQLELQDSDYAQFADIAVKQKQSHLAVKRTQQAMQLHQVKLAQLVGQSVTENAMYSPGIVPLDTKDVLVERANDNPKIQAARLMVKSLGAKVRSFKGQLFPKVSLYLKYEEEESSIYFNGEGVTNKLAYVNVDIPLFQSGKEYVNVSRASKQKQIAELELKHAIESTVEALTLDHQQLMAVNDQLSVFQNILAITEDSVKRIQHRVQEKALSRLDGVIQESSLVELNIQQLRLELDRYLTYFRIQHAVGAIIK